MINEEIDSLIYDTVSDYANNHWTRYDFDNEYQRGKYLEEIADGGGWIDDVEDEVYSELEGQTWEDEHGKEHEIDLNDPDVRQAITDQICREADYWRN